jgi:hypothetical protein
MKGNILLAVLLFFQFNSIANSNLVNQGQVNAFLKGKN